MFDIKIETLMLSGQTSKAARCLLDWSQEDLASTSGLSIATVRRFECSDDPYAFHMRTVASLTAAFEAHGVSIDFQGEGLVNLRWRKGQKEE